MLLSLLLPTPNHSPSTEELISSICIQACFSPSLLLSPLSSGLPTTPGSLLSWLSFPPSSKPLSKLQLLTSFKDTHLLSLLYSKVDFRFLLGKVLLVTSKSSADPSAAPSPLTPSHVLPMPGILLPTPLPASPGKPHLQASVHMHFPPQAFLALHPHVQFRLSPLLFTSRLMYMSFSASPGLSALPFGSLVWTTNPTRPDHDCPLVLCLEGQLVTSKQSRCLGGQVLTSHSHSCLLACFPVLLRLGG